MIRSTHRRILALIIFIHSFQLYLSTSVDPSSITHLPPHQSSLLISQAFAFIVYRIIIIVSSISYFEKVVTP
ncbi:hypothetical protein EYC80_005086 [Monilinia laxa]|uniref:Uncharacterized protein n=1 Tax=Monilinia laxa TaxID=61186 RepID=A0A5N6KJE8_MONLA|nr:hypothetical protein EYC80_005086 [Monilinia laxa]